MTAATRWQVARASPEGRRSAARRAAARRPARRPLLPLTDARKRRGKARPTISGRGGSADKTLGWDWKVDANGAHHFRAFLWNGARYRAGARRQTSPAPAK